MRRRGGLALAAFVSLLLLVPAAWPARAEDVPEPPDYRIENYRSPTPLTLAGARVVTVQEAYKLWHEGGAIFVDVMPRPVRPPDLLPDTLWRDQTRATIPSTVWLPNVGYGKLPQAMDDYFRNSLDAIAVGDKAKPLLFFCMADCWMSWNAARRAHQEYGYSNVIWFPQGTDGWHFPDAPLVNVEPRH